MNERLQILLELQEIFTKKKNQALVGSIQQVLVEGISKKESSGSLMKAYPAVQWTGRTTTNKIVNFHHNDIPGSSENMTPGKLVPVKIEKAFSHSLWGSTADFESTAEGLKGEKSYAA